MPELNIVIVCFDFPPNEGIGGRRWAKFAKGLVESGYEVNVIKAEPAGEYDNSGWTSDTISSRLHVNTLPRKFPRVLSHGPQNLVEKVLYRFHKLRLRLTEKGTIYDRSIGWEPYLTTRLKSLNEKRPITHLIATGAPFNVLYYCALFKSLHQSIFFHTDYRDPWIEGKNYGMENISALRRKEEIRKENFVLQNANLVTSPLPSFTALLKSKNQHGKECQFYNLEHFFDPDDFKTAQNQSLADEEKKTTLVYGGALYMGIEKYLKYIPQALNSIAPEQRSLFEFRFYTPDQIPLCLRNTSPSVKVNPPIGKRIYDELSRADAILLLLPDHMPDSRTTKFYEILSFKKPILYLGPKGEVASFIQSEKLGVIASNSSEIKDFLLDLHQGQIQGNAVKVDSHTLNNRTAELISLLKISI